MTEPHMKTGLKLIFWVVLIPGFHPFSDSFGQFCQECKSLLPTGFTWGLVRTVNKVGLISHRCYSPVSDRYSRFLPDYSGVCNRTGRK